jgi:hypothetical protein
VVEIVSPQPSSSPSPARKKDLFDGGWRNGLLTATAFLVLAAWMLGERGVPLRIVAALTILFLTLRIFVRLRRMARWSRQEPTKPCAQTRHRN